MAPPREPVDLILPWGRGGGNEKTQGRGARPAVSVTLLGPRVTVAVRPEVFSSAKRGSSTAGFRRVPSGLAFLRSSTISTLCSPASAPSFGWNVVRRNVPSAWTTPRALVFFSG